MFNPILYLITLFELFIARKRAKAAKNAMNHKITKTRTDADELDRCYENFLKRANREEKLAVKLKRIKNQNTDFAILKVCLNLGDVMKSKGAESLTKLDISTALTRHKHGDWGEQERNRWIDNNMAVIEGTGVICSRYKYHGGGAFLINTDILNRKTRICLEGE